MPWEDIRFYRATGQYGFLSNLYPCEVRVPLNPKETAFAGTPELVTGSAEHAYQWAKANSTRMRADILAVKLPRSAAILGHGLYRFDVVEDWSNRKYAWMQRVIRAKFRSANPASKALGKKLADTGQRPLIEASKTDAYWGIGKTEMGLNNLGGLLMETRDAILYEVDSDE